MRPGSYGLTAEERRWLREICREESLDGAAPAVPAEVAQRLLEYRLIEPSGSSYSATSAGFAEALRTT